MFNIKNQITIKKIFFIIIFIYNKKLILIDSQDSKFDSEQKTLLEKALPYAEDENFNAEQKTLFEKALSYTKEGQLLENLERDKEAGEAYEKSGKTYNDIAESYIKQAGLLYNLQATRWGRKKAREMKHNAEKAYDNSAGQFNHAAKCYIEDALSHTFIKNDENKATNSFQKSAELYANSGACYTNRAKLLDSSGNKKEAELAYEKSSNKYQKSANLYNIIALYYLKEVRLSNNLKNEEEPDAYINEEDSDNNEK